jgi:NitT/TauT family transport system permease protein
MTTDIVVPASESRPPGDRARRLLAGAIRIATPIVSVMALWYLAIWFSGLPAFVIPLPERVLEVLWQERAFIFEHLLSTLQVAAIGFLWANVAGIGLAVLFDLLPPTRHMLMPAAITLRNVPYIALISVLMLAFGDSILSKTTIVALAGFFPVLVNTMAGLRAADEVQLVADFQPGPAALCPAVDRGGPGDHRLGLDHRGDCRGVDDLLDRAGLRHQSCNAELPG